jgi:hypothetical protein
MVTWTQVNAKLDLFLDDAAVAGVTQFAIPTLRVEAWNWAQRMLCYHTPMQKNVTLEIEKGGREAILPTDFFAPEGIYDADRERWWKPMRWRPGDRRYTDEELPEFWVWGGRMFLEDEIDYDADDLTLYYWAYYPDVEYETSGDEVTYLQEQIHTPLWAELALCHLTTATCMMPGEVFSADLNQYKIRVESGTPLHNPRAESAKFHLWWWNALLDKYPPARDSVVK